ncbi:hypothetical protein GEMRC1_013672 [Eukaryota sp. GEM-RC1]
MCEVEVVLPGVSQMILKPHSDLFLLELEFYGYKSNSCLRRIDINKGITALGDEIEDEIHLEFDNERFSSLEQFRNAVSKSSHLISATHLSYSTYLTSSKCLHSIVRFFVTFTPGNAVELLFVQNVVEIDSHFQTISIPISCTDSIGFIVDCIGNVTVLESSFDWSYFELIAGSLTFTCSSGFNFAHHYLKVEFLEHYFESSFKIVQMFSEILIIDHELVPCPHQMMFDKSCTLLKPHVSLIRQHHF